jgi:hypothetical protein
LSPLHTFSPRGWGPKSWPPTRLLGCLMHGVIRILNVAWWLTVRIKHSPHWSSFRSVSSSSLLPARQTPEPERRRKHLHTMKICEYCRKTVLQGNRAWNYHHTRYVLRSIPGQEKSVDEAMAPSVVRSAIERCLFCTTLKEDIDSLAPHITKERCVDAWPIYRWNIRALSKIRESRETVVVTFRYVPPKEGVEYAVGDKEVELPTRTFFFFLEDGRSILRNQQLEILVCTVVLSSSFADAMQTSSLCSAMNKSGTRRIQL